MTTAQISRTKIKGRAIRIQTASPKQQGRAGYARSLAPCYSRSMGLKRGVFLNQCRGRRLDPAVDFTLHNRSEIGILAQLPRALPFIACFGMAAGLPIGIGQMVKDG